MKVLVQVPGIGVQRSVRHVVVTVILIFLLGHAFFSFQQTGSVFAAILDHANPEKFASQVASKASVIYATTANESIPMTTTTTSPTRAASTAFDEIANTALGMVFSGPGRTTANPLRKEFDLKTWTKGTGGLTDKDRIMLAEIYTKASSVFEFGLGESTLIASHVGVPRYAGIDSDAVWVSKTRDEVQPHFRFYLADIGKSLSWGFPEDKGLAKSVLDYQIAPLLVEPYAFDVYMVDGRSRLACMIASFLHASSHDARSDTLVLMHDCLPTIAQQKTLNRGNRVYYKEADHLLNRVSHSGDKLCAYQRKPNTTDDALLQLWQKHFRNWE